VRLQRATTCCEHFLAQAGDGGPLRHLVSSAKHEQCRLDLLEKR
jgi:hypothetical protein